MKNVTILLSIIKDAQRCYNSLNWNYSKKVSSRLENHVHNFKKITGRDLTLYFEDCPA